MVFCFQGIVAGPRDTQTVCKKGRLGGVHCAHDFTPVLASFCGGVHGAHDFTPVLASFCGVLSYSFLSSFVFFLSFSGVVRIVLVLVQMLDVR